MEKTQSLYRPEVLAAQRADWLGVVMLTTSPSMRWAGGLAAVVVCALVALVVFGSFTNKVRVNGWLIPEKGMTRVFTSIAGTVTDLQVSEGTRVSAGDRLLTISTEVESAALGATQAEIGRLLGTRRQSLQAEIRQQQALMKQQREALDKRIAAIANEIEQLGSEASVQASRARLAEGAARRLTTLQGQGFVSLAQVQQQQELALEQRGRVATLNREQAERRRELVTLRAEADELPLRAASTISTLERTISQIDEEQALTASRSSVVLTAPQAGVVTSLQAENGSAANPSIPLLTIMPTDSRLEAQMFSPSRAIGFIKEGQAVQLRYAAFPYQKFGHHSGTIRSVSRAGVSPADLPRELNGLGEMFGTTEPVYRIDVALSRQTVLAYGEQYSLQPGMRLEADVLMEKRRLYEWILDPLYSLTGRL